MTIRSSAIKKRITYHILFWATYILWSSYVLGSDNEQYLNSFLNDLVYLPFKIVITYAILYFILPRYYKPGQYFQLVLILIVLTVISALFFRVIRTQFTYPFLYPNYKFNFWSFGSILWGAFDIMSIAAIAVSIKLFKTNFESLQREKELEKEKLQNELNFLRAQINPHFLFNTLNNIYGLSLKNSEQTSPSILKLSELLRFILHDGTLQSIKLSEEVKVLEDYIELEKLRYGGRLAFTFEKEIDDVNTSISPLLLLPFIENSFKHGASESRFNSYIHVRLKLVNKQLTFSVENSKENEAGKNDNGIGLKNIKRQLELIYDNAHELTIKETTSSFSVNLFVNLKKHE